MFKVYVAGLYLPEKKTTAAGVLATQGPRRLKLVMLREVNSEDFGQAFMEAKAAKGGPGLQAGITTPEMKAATDTHVIGNPAYLAQRERAERPLNPAAVADLLEGGPIDRPGVP